jgi:DNA modification methylase
MVRDLQNVDIVDPKRARCSSNGRTLWYPYYAGYSPEFARRFLASVLPVSPEMALDPWNGSGTSTWAANVLGIPSVGVDLNPVMLVVAKARLLSRRERPSLVPLGFEIIDSLENGERHFSADPLTTWLAPSSARHVRAIERRIHDVLLPPNLTCVEGYSSLAAFFYVALFRVVRLLTQDFVGSNPTWVRRPRHPSQRPRPSLETVTLLFGREVKSMSLALEECADLTEAPVTLLKASSRDLPLQNDSVDVILTSPPYCTRIDYAITTARELAVLGVDMDESLRKLRSEMIGTSTISDITPKSSAAAWGPSCTAFLEAVRTHGSKNSHDYYYRNHLQYFDALFCSVRELARVLRTGGLAVVVVQDSYYKDVHNDLPTIAQQMLESTGLKTVSRQDFKHYGSIAQINTSRHRTSSVATEAVILAKRRP